MAEKSDSSSDSSPDPAGALHGHLKGVEALHAIFDLTDWFAGTRDLQRVLNDTAQRIAEVMNVKACGIRLLDEETGEMVIKAVHNLSESYLNKGPVVLDENPVDKAAMRGESVYIADISNDPRMVYPLQARAEGLVSCLSVPMTYRGTTVGVIRVYTGRRYEFTEREEALLRSAGSQAAAGIVEARLVEEQRERERYTRQMEYAGEIQRRMIPDHPPVHPFVEFGAVYDPSFEVGGDFYDYLEFEGGAVGFSIADVVGKGIPASLIMASTRSALRAHAVCADGIEELLASVNRHLCRDTLPGEFVTAFFGIFQADRPRLVYANAGHDPPLLLRGERIIELDTGGMVLGVVQEAEFNEETIDLKKNDTLVFYTDGVIDALNFEGETFGRQRLRKSIFRYRKCAPLELAEQIKWDTRRFSGLAPQTDDITVVVARVVA